MKQGGFMESNMKGFKFYEKHCMKTVIIFFMVFLCSILMYAISIRSNDYEMGYRFQRDHIEDLRNEIKELKLKINK